ncbi:MAG: tetratricopeptide repeat protein, partial [Dolichospermum sp.]
VVLSNLKKYKEAAAAINKAIELSPRAAFYNNRGNVRNDLGDKQGAIDDFNQAIKINPNDANAYINRGFTKYELVYSSITFGGMSGGPVLDSQGRVIGIHGRTEGEA